MTRAQSDFSETYCEKRTPIHTIFTPHTTHSPPILITAEPSTELIEPNAKDSQL